MRKKDEEALSPRSISELCTDHALEDPPEDLGALGARGLGEKPASTATQLGQSALAVAEEYLRIPLREDDGPNRDKAGLIRQLFLDGLNWSPDTWDRWAELHPKYGVAKPEWCAAFASYCVRKAYKRYGVKLPATLRSTSSDMADSFGSVGRFLKRGDLFDKDGRLNPQLPPPGPGDIVIWQKHVGLLQEIFPSGAFTTLEGNTWHGATRNDGVYRCNRHSMETRKIDGSFQLVGFCILASKDGLSGQRSV